MIIGAIIIIVVVQKYDEHMIMIRTCPCVVVGRKKNNHNNYANIARLCPACPGPAKAWPWA